MAVLPLAGPARALIEARRAGPAAVPTRPDRKFIRTPAGRTLRYAEAGAGPDLLLIHGTLTTLDDMRLGPMEALSKHFHVVAVDRPGHGGSDHARLADASPWAEAATIRGAAHALALRRPVICGHSFGGAVALAYGMAYPDEVAGIVAMAPICFPELRLEHLLFGGRAVPVWGDILAGAMGSSLDPAMLALLWRAMFLPQAMPARFAAEFPFALAGRPEQTVTEGENAVALWPGLARSALAYGNCRVPVRVLGGDADIVVNTLAHGCLAAQMIPGARFELLPGIGHMLHHFRVDAVEAAVRAVAGL